MISSGNAVASFVTSFTIPKILSPKVSTLAVYSGFIPPACSIYSAIFFLNSLILSIKSKFVFPNNESFISICVYNSFSLLCFSICSNSMFSFAFFEIVIRPLSPNVILILIPANIISMMIVTTNDTIVIPFLLLISIFIIHLSP